MCPVRTTIVCKLKGKQSSPVPGLSYADKMFEELVIFHYRIQKYMGD